MALAITIDREALDLAVRFLQSANVSRVRVTVSASGYGALSLSDASGSQTVSLAGKSGVPTAGSCDVPSATLRRVLDAVPSYEVSATLYVSALTYTSVADASAESGVRSVAVPASVRITYGLNVAASADATIAAA